MKNISIELDRIDLELIDLLKSDGRMSFTDIADKMDLAVSTIRNRYNKLVNEQILHILGWVDPVKSNINSYSRVTIEVQPSGKLESVVDQLSNIKEVSFLAITSGPSDIEINLLCRDHNHLLELMKNQIHCIKGVHKTTSTVYFEVRKWASRNIFSSSSN